MTDTETHAELNRLLAADESDLTVDDLLKLPPGAISLLHLLAKSQRALREIIELIITGQSIEAVLTIAKNACKEE